MKFDQIRPGHLGIQNLSIYYFRLTIQFSSLILIFKFHFNKSEAKLDFMLGYIYFTDFNGGHVDAPEGGEITAEDGTIACLEIFSYKTRVLRVL